MAVKQRGGVCLVSCGKGPHLWMWSIKYATRRENLTIVFEYTDFYKNINVMFYQCKFKQFMSKCYTDRAVPRFDHFKIFIFGPRSILGFRFLYSKFYKHHLVSITGKGSVTDISTILVFKVDAATKA